MSDKIVWSGKTSSYHHKWNDTPNPEGEEAGLRKVWFLDAQWSTCPVEVENQVKDLWRLYECGNDKYIIKMDMKELINMAENPHDYCAVERRVDGKWVEGPIDVTAILQYARETGVQDDERIIIHWWW